jgi:hypothetical protein
MLLGLMGFRSKNTVQRGMIVKPSEIKVSAVSRQKSTNDSAVSTVPNEGVTRPAVPASSTKEETVAKTDNRNVPKEKTQPPPDPLKGQTPPPESQVYIGTPSVQAAILPGGGIINSPKTPPVTDTDRSEVAAGQKPAGLAAPDLKARSGSYPFSIKLNSSRTSEEARSTLPAYNSKDLNAYWVKVNLGSQGVWYRIFAGYYPTLQQAEAVISRIGLENAVVKATKYAACIGMFSSQTEVDQKLKLLSDKGYCPYFIPGRDQTRFLFVGAFYTRKGAEEQVVDLLSKGIQSEIVER